MSWIVVTGMSLALSILTVWLIWKFFLPHLERGLIVNENPEKADAILILGGESQGERIELGAKLYKQGYAGTVLLAGNGEYNWKEQAISHGIKAEYLIREPISNTTLDNAKFSYQIVTENGFRKVIIVTSDYHSKRALMLFSNVFKNSDIKLIMCSARTNLVSVREKIRRIGGEYLKILHYFLFSA